MKSLKYLLLFFVLGITFTSCNDDGYSLDDFVVSFATVNDLGDNSFYLISDYNGKLGISAPTNVAKPKTKRVIANYTILSDTQGGYDHLVKLNGISSVLTKNVIYIAPSNQVEQDRIGNDPIQIHTIFESGGYLNIKFGYNAGGVEAHLVNLVSASPDLSVPNDKVELEFRHNQSGDPERYPSVGYVSFDLAPYKIAGRDKVTFDVKVKDFEGKEKVFTIEYTYKVE